MIYKEYVDKLNKVSSKSILIFNGVSLLLLILAFLIKGISAFMSLLFIILIESLLLAIILCFGLIVLTIKLIKEEYR